MQTSYLTQLVLPLALFSIMFGVGLTLSRSDFMRLLQRPGIVLLGLGAQLILLPLLGAMVLWCTEVPPLLGAGLMILTLAPGGATSNMLTLLARGDTALSVTLTAITSLVTPFTLPLLTLVVLDVYGLSEVMPPFPVLVTLLKMVLVTLLPVGLGMLVASVRPSQCTRLIPPIKVCSLIFMVLTVSLIMWANWARLPELIGAVGPVSLLLAVCALLTGYLLAAWAGVSGAGKVTLAIEVGIQNAGTALLVTGGLLQSAEMSVGVLIYGVLMQLPVLVLIGWRNRDLIPVSSTSSGFTPLD
ncbi:bile acid:sodium symporter family protein [Marinobacterium marinum]|uniref:Bile acid:sodium symporter family protein n=1 Tax=Marinobacterium marinum TaxID=2756129 RepID=A0A7W1WXH6_9GAMM|nr:bile acid:sodium symporter family protein [Marinobacterium marinum]MBA4501952.1 bile acid:sodium symporter family protein [Marinobacterium marinum]